LTNQAGQDWIERKGITLNMSTGPKIRNPLATFLDRRDVVAMWERPVNVYTFKLIQEFTLESFQASDTVETYSQKLLHYPCKLQSSEYPISEPQLVLRLCLGMPNTLHWNLTKHSAKCNFQEAVTQFLITDLLRPSQAADSAIANLAESNARGRGSRRNCGRDSRNAGKDTSDVEDYSNRCFWCLREGHMKNECRDFKKAKARARKRKMHESFNKRTDTRATERLDRIHTDISRIMPESV
jgi:hypothetical protein